MVAGARARGLDARVMDAERLPFDGEFDAVFSNAALHWVRDHDAMLAGVHRALKAGRAIRGRVRRPRQHRRHPGRHTKRARAPRDGRRTFIGTTRRPQNTPRVSSRTDSAVTQIDLIPRPTPLPTGMRGWLETFERATLDRIPSDRAGVVHRGGGGSAARGGLRLGGQLDRPLRPTALSRNHQPLTTNPNPPTTQPYPWTTSPIPSWASRSRISAMGRTSKAQRSAVRRRRHHRGESAGHRFGVLGHHPVAAWLSAAPSRPHPHRRSALPGLAARAAPGVLVLSGGAQDAPFGPAAVLAAHRHRACEPPRARRPQQLRRPSVLSGRQQVVLRRRRLHPGTVAVAAPRDCGRMEWPERYRTARRRAPHGAVAGRCGVGWALFRSRRWHRLRLAAASLRGPRLACRLAREPLRDSPCCAVIIGGFIGASRVARRAAVDALHPSAARTGGRRHPDAESCVARSAGL